MSITELNGAKQLVHQDPSLYPTVVDSLLSIAERPEVGLRRWCSLFFMDALTSLELANSVKTELAIKILPKLNLLASDQDPQVLKIALGCAGNAYPLVFGFLCRNPQQDVWALLSSIKKKSSMIWDETKHIGVKASCIKFSQVMVQTQSKLQNNAGPPDVNLLSIPQNHPFLDPVYLTAEAQGLLDRILGYFDERCIQPAVLAASLNAALTLVSSRPQMGQKIINSICNMKLEQKTGLDTQVAIRFVDKSLQLDLKYIGRSFPQYASPINRFVARVGEFSARSSLRKRAATQEGEDSSKRVKLAQNDWPVNTATTMPDGEQTLSELFKLVDPKNVLAQFNVKDLPLDVAVRMALSGLKNANTTLLNNCISIIKQRSEGVEIIKESLPDSTPTPEEPSLPATAAAEPAAVEEPEEDVLTITLAEDDETTKKTAGILNRVVRLAASAPAAPAEELTGLDRQIRWSRDSWVYLVSRIATRAVPDDSVVAERVREYLYKYVMSDFRKYLDMIVIWLSEEWFAENVLADPVEGMGDKSFYFETLGRIIDQILPRMEVSDSKMFIRLLSDVPALNESIVLKLKSVCQDPDRSLLGTRALKFLIMLKPPIKDSCLDLVQQLFEQNVDGMEGILRRYRPSALP